MNRRWLSAYDPGVPQSIEYPVVPVYKTVLDMAARNPKDVALYFGDATVKFGELASHIEAFASAIAELGVSPGDMVGIYMPNCPEVPIAYYGVMRAGATAVMLSPALVERELAQAIGDAGFKVLICNDAAWRKVSSVQEGADLHAVIATGCGFAPTGKREILPRGPQVHDFVGLLERGGPALPEPDIDPREDPCVLIYTGGTTGLPKAVVLTHYAVVANAAQLAAWVEFGKGDSVLAALPLFHSYGMSAGINAPLFKGAATVLIGSQGWKELVGAIEKARPKLLIGVPSTLAVLTELPGIETADMSSLEYVFVGSAPLPADVRQRFENLTDAVLLEGYGLTEAVTAQSANPAHGVNKPGSIGIPFPDVEFRIVDLETGTRELAPEKTGELTIKSPCLMKGYHNRPRETETTVRDGWLFTGDIARMDDEGYFYIIDRRKDMIVSGAFKAYPAEVEAVLRTHPLIKEVAVVGLFDDFRGLSLKAFVVTEQGAGLTADDVKKFAGKNLSEHKVPRAVEFREELPKTKMGKILRKELEQ